MAGFQCPAGKDSWPELLGAQATDAKAIIESENPLVKAEIVIEGTVVPINILPVCDRVWVWVDKYDTVTRVPIIG